MAEKKKKPAKQADPLSPLGLADWVESQAGETLVNFKDEALRVEKIIALLRSPRHRSNASRRCCATMRGSADHAEDCPVEKETK